ncbi:MAG: sugar transferase [Dorea sp.]|jgi:undecaprenyl phosphate N,N'-diacetylbacillosamine 1-phosphate transferase|nr:sugar transferase [Dorea sp.]
MKWKRIYCKYVKRCLDFWLSLIGILILTPVLLIFTVTGFFIMKGNPFFFQERPGKDEVIFQLIKFRTMSNAKDKNGNLLPDIQRLNRYGRFLRSTSIDELPELFNILKGDMSFVGPRPLAVQYLPYYNNEERRRHSVLPGLTGLAQINGRNAVNWPERFKYDLRYVDNLSFVMDVTIIAKTAFKVFKRGEVNVRGTGNVIDFDKYRMQEKEFEHAYNDEKQ